MLLHTRILSRRCSPWILLFISHLEVTVQNPSKSLFLSQRDWFCNKMQLLHEFRSVRANDGGFAMRKTDGTLWTSADIGVPVKAASTRPITKFPDRKHAVLWWVTRTHSCILQHKYTVCTCDLKSVWTDSGRCDVSRVALQHHAEFSPHNLDCLHWVFRCHVTAPAWINMSAFACAADFGAKFSAEVCSWTSSVAKKQQKKLQKGRRLCKNFETQNKTDFPGRECRSCVWGQCHSYKKHNRKLWISFVFTTNWCSLPTGKYFQCILQTIN